MTLALLGLALIGFGLAGLRIMARRSVSLAALRAIRAGADPGEAFGAGIAARIEDAERLRLVRVEGSRLLRRCFGVRS
jgi:hypothetical protein